VIDDLDVAAQIAETVLAEHAEFRASQPHAGEIADAQDTGRLAALARAVLVQRKEIVQLKLRPPMGCYTCEGHNEQLVDRIERMCEAVCPACAALPAFVAAQQWPLPDREGNEIYDDDVKL